MITAAVGHNTVNQAVQIDEHENNENNVDNEDVVFFDTQSYDYSGEDLAF